VAENRIQTALDRAFSQASQAPQSRCRRIGNAMPSQNVVWRSESWTRRGFPQSG